MSNATEASKNVSNRKCHMATERPFTKFVPRSTDVVDIWRTYNRYGRTILAPGFLRYFCPNLMRKYRNFKLGHDDHAVYRLAVAIDGPLIESWKIGKARIIVLIGVAHSACDMIDQLDALDAATINTDWVCVETRTVVPMGRN